MYIFISIIRNWVSILILNYPNVTEKSTKPVDKNGAPKLTVLKWTVWGSHKFFWQIAAGSATRQLSRYQRQIGRPSLPTSNERPRPSMIYWALFCEMWHNYLSIISGILCLTSFEKRCHKSRQECFEKRVACIVRNI